MSGIINTSIVTSVTLGSVAYPDPLTITAAGTVAPALSVGAGAAGLYLPGSSLGIVMNDGMILGGAGASGYAAGYGALISVSAVLSLSGSGTIQAADGFADGSLAGLGGTGISLQAGATLLNGTALTAGNTILGGTGGVSTGSSFSAAGNGGAGIALDSNALAQNFGLIIGGAGGYSSAYGGAGGTGATLGAGASLDNEGTVVAGVGGAALIVDGNGGIGVDVSDGASLSNGGSISGGNGTSDGNAVSHGGLGVNVQAGGTASNASSGIISGGEGGAGPGVSGLQAGYGGVGVYVGSYYTFGTDSRATLVSAGSFVNDGQVLGGAGGYGGAAGVGGEGGIGLQLGVLVSASNDGTIAGGAGATGGVYGGGGGLGVLLVAYSSFNNTSLVIGGSGGLGPDAAGGVGLEAVGYVSISNIGTIAGGDGGANAVGNTGYGGGGLQLNADSALNNYGVIKGGNAGALSVGGTYAGGGGYGAVVGTGAALTNSSMGLILGGDGSGNGHYGGFGVVLESSRLRGPGGHVSSLDNQGTIIGGNAGGMGASGTYTAYASAGVYFNGGALTNSGEITGGNAGIPGGTGTYTGMGGAGVEMLDGTLVNASSGMITGGTAAIFGGVGILLEGGTLVNAGTISGGMGGGTQATAVFFASYYAELAVYSGAVFNGAVVAQPGEGDILALGGAAPGSLSGIGTEFSGFDTLSFLTGASWSAEGGVAALAGTLAVDGFGPADTIVLDGFTASSETYVSGTGLELSDGTSFVTIDITGVYDTADFSITDVAGATDITTDALCYLRGTRILGPVGARLVEELAIGDRVVTRFGGTRKIKWIGRQSYDARFLHNNKGQVPVRIAAGALGEGAPARALVVSPGHSVLLGGALVLARALVNGINITQNLADEAGLIEYFQIELESHDCVMAEGAWAETYADAPGLRAQYHNAAEFAALYPDYETPAALRLCAPRPERGADLAAALLPVVAQASAGLRPGVLDGSIDSVTAACIEGWAQDKAHPDLPMLLEVWAGERLLGSVLACAHRADLAQAGLGNGNHAFSFTLPEAVPAHRLADLRVLRAVDGAALWHSPACRAALGCTNMLAFRSAARA